jgi:hypothetical protein
MKISIEEDTFRMLLKTAYIQGFISKKDTDTEIDNEQADNWVNMMSVHVTTHNEEKE